MIKTIYGNKTDLLQRESMGLVTQDMASVFKTKYVEAMLKADDYTLTKEPSFCFISVDPNGGGSSNMAIVSMCVEYNKIILVGLDTKPCKSHEEIEKFLTTHVEQLRKHPRLKECWFVCVLENNLGHEADHLSFILKPYRKVYVLTEKNGVIGVCTTHTRKELYAMETVKYFCQESIKIWKDLVISNVGSSREAVLQDFKEQLLQFKRIIVSPMRGFALPKIHYSGKANGGQDDFVMALIMCVYWVGEFLTQRTEAPYDMFGD